jgi:hypothetical protein
VTRPWLTLPPPPEVRCWRTTPEGRQWQAQVQAAIDGADVTGTNQKGPQTAPAGRWGHDEPPDRDVDERGGTDDLEGL